MILSQTVYQVNILLNVTRVPIYFTFLRTRAEQNNKWKCLHY